MNKIEEIIKEKGIKKSWLAKKLNVSNQTITNWVKGYNYPDISKAKQLADLLGYPIEEIFFNNKVNVDTNIDRKVI